VSVLPICQNRNTYGDPELNWIEPDAANGFLVEGALTRQNPAALLLFLCAIPAMAQDAPVKAAARYLPGVSWQPDSVVTGDFTCNGRKQQALLGTTTTEIVVVVFVNGSYSPPVVIRDSGRNPATAELTTEDSDYEPEYSLPGFRRSKTCRGLNINDGMIDQLHIYWNRIAHRFDNWSH